MCSFLHSDYAIQNIRHLSTNSVKLEPDHAVHLFIFHFSSSIFSLFESFFHYSINFFIVFFVLCILGHQAFVVFSFVVLYKGFNMMHPSFFSFFLLYFKSHLLLYESHLLFAGSSISFLQ
jgi:hypothetical protein